MPAGEASVLSHDTSRFKKKRARGGGNGKLQIVFKTGEKEENVNGTGPNRNASLALKESLEGGGGNESLGVQKTSSSLPYIITREHNLNATRVKGTLRPMIECKPLERGVETDFFWGGGKTVPHVISKRRAKPTEKEVSDFASKQKKKQRT